VRAAAAREACRSKLGYNRACARNPGCRPEGQVLLMVVHGRPPGRSQHRCHSRGEVAAEGRLVVLETSRQLVPVATGCDGRPGCRTRPLTRPGHVLPPQGRIIVHAVSSKRSTPPHQLCARGTARPGSDGEHRRADTVPTAAVHTTRSTKKRTPGRTTTRGRVLGPYRDQPHRNGAHRRVRPRRNDGIHHARQGLS